MTMRWVIERDLFLANGQTDFQAQLKQRGSDFRLVDFIPVSHEILPKQDGSARLFGMGSTSFVREIQSLGWDPGVWYDRDRFRFEACRDALGDLLLNSDGDVRTFENLVFEGRRFLRPAEDLKPFVGTVVHADNLGDWRERVLRYSEVSEENLIAGDTPVVVAEPKTITAEWRFFVVDGRVVTGCQYKPTETRLGPEDAAWWFAQEAADRYAPAEGFVIDVAALERGYRVVEYNCLNAAGLYGCDREAIIAAVEAAI